jgi:hypothetical protein
MHRGKPRQQDRLRLVSYGPSEGFRPPQDDIGLWFVTFVDADAPMLSVLSYLDR